MAIKFLHDLDLSGQEIQNLKLHVTGTPPTAAAGAIYFDSGANVVKVHDGTSFKTISTDTSDNVLTGLSFATGTGVLTASTTDGASITVSLDGRYAASSHTHATSDITSGTFDNARIASSNVTQHEGDITHDNLSGFVANEHIDWTTDQGSTNIHTGNYNNTQLSDTEVIAAVVASTGISGSDKTAIRSNIGAGTSSLTLGTTSTTALAGNTTTISSTQANNITTNNAKVSFPGFGTSSGTALEGDTSLLQIGTSSTTALAGNTAVDNVSKTNLATVLASFNSGDTVNIGDADDDTTVVIRGNLQVDGATTTVSSETLTIADNKIVLNNNYTGSSPSENAGIEIERGTQTNTVLRWNETTDRWQFVDLTGTYSIPRTGDFNPTIGTDTNVSASSGATVISSLTLTDGVITNASTRSLTASDIGAQGTMTFGIANTNAVKIDDADAADNDYARFTAAGLEGRSFSEVRDDLNVANGATADAKASGAEIIAASDDTKFATPASLAAKSVHATIDVSDSNFASSPHKATIQHGLSTEDVVVQLFDSSTKQTVYADVTRKTFAGSNSTTSITVTFSKVPDNDIEVLITSIKGSTAKTPSYS